MDVEIHGKERLQNVSKEIFPKMPVKKEEECFFCHKESPYNDIEEHESIIQMIMMRDGICGECAGRMLYGIKRHTN